MKEIMFPDVDYGIIEETAETVETAADALIASKRSFGGVNVEYMEKIFRGFSETTLFELRDKGMIFQDPEYFRTERYTARAGWVLRENYLSGYITNKLKTAREMNSLFCGVFEKNIDALIKMLPAPCTVDEITITPGATWISPQVIEMYIKDRYDIRGEFSIKYYPDTARWCIILSDKAKREIRSNVNNCFTFGTKGMFPGTTRGRYAIRILELGMNGAVEPEYDYEYDSNGRVTKQTVNKEATAADLEKWQQQIADFNKFVHDNPEARALTEDCINQNLVGYARSPYSGEFLEFSDMVPVVTPFEHQKSTIARIKLSNENLAVVHSVGTGKSIVFICAAHELAKDHPTRKNMIVTTNNTLKWFVDMHRSLYPQDKLLVITPRDFVPAKRNKALEKVKAGDFTAVYISASSFDKLELSADERIKQKKVRIDNLRRKAENSTDSFEKSYLISQAYIESSKLARTISNEKDTPWPTFDSLGIDTLFVDEFHQYKNIPIDTVTNVTGINTAGSKKCSAMLEKAHFVKRLIVATGTPITNSICDLYTLQLYLQPELLRLHSFDSFDMWLKTFAEYETCVELDVSCSKMRTVSRFTKFTNLPELMAMFSCVCDFHYSEENDPELPVFNGYTDVTVSSSRELIEFQRKLVERTELIRSRGVTRAEDNLLKVTIDARLAAVDPKLAGVPSAGVSSKLIACADKVFETYRDYPGTCQIVFSDIGTPKPGVFNVYDTMRTLLEKRGICSDEIAYVHDATSEKAKTKLFSDMNAGKLRVVIGSTEKLGVGVNVQENLKAIHHLSIPWKCSDIEQRNGRIIRRGNNCKEVFIFRYVTENSFDAYSWEILEKKSKFIASFLSGTCTARSETDIADSVLDYAEIKARAIGDPLIKVRVETANALTRTQLAKAQRSEEIRSLSALLSTLPDEIKSAAALRSSLSKDVQHYSSSKVPLTNAERTAFGEELMEALKLNFLRSKERLFDTFQGFSVMLPANMTEEKPYVLLRSPNGSSYQVFLGSSSPLGLCRGIELFLDNLRIKLSRTSTHINNLKKRRIEAEDNIRRGNEYEEPVQRLTARLNEIDNKLNENKNAERN